jgi:hypothetical protein
MLARREPRGAQVRLRAKGQARSRECKARDRGIKRARSLARAWLQRGAGYRPASSMRLDMLLTLTTTHASATDLG